MTSSGLPAYAEDEMVKEPGETMSNNQQQIAYHEIDQRRPADTATGVLWVAIPYTTPELTLEALRHAGAGTDLNVQISLVDIQVVPFPCPLDQPLIDRKFSEGRLRNLFAQTNLAGTTGIVYARDRLEGYRQALAPASLVILATRKHWWRTREQKLARSLQKAGHHVMLLRN